jgi:hypothetical protein
MQQAVQDNQIAASTFAHSACTCAQHGLEQIVFTSTWEAFWGDLGFSVSKLSQ